MVTVDIREAPFRFSRQFALEEDGEWNVLGVFGANAAFMLETLSVHIISSRTLDVLDSPPVRQVLWTAAYPRGLFHWPCLITGALFNPSSELISRAG